MKVLGLSAFHGSATAALAEDGVPLCAIREESLSGVPGDTSMPFRAARAVLAQAGLTGPELDGVVFYEKPLRRFERTLVSALRAFPRGGRAFARETSRWLGDRLWMKGTIAAELGVDPSRISFVEHLVSHAACAYLLSPFDDATIVVVDDVGEWATTCVAAGRAGEVELLEQAQLPHSWGLVVSAFAQYLGFDPGRDDRMLFGLARLGEPRMAAEVAELLPAGPDDAPRVAPGCFHFTEGAERLYGSAIEERFGAPREPGTPLRITAEDTRDADLAASVCAVLTKRIESLVRRAVDRVGSRRVCMAGSLAQDRRLLAELLQRGVCDELFVPPEPTDPGAALGAALLISSAGRSDGTRPPLAELWETRGQELVLVDEREPDETSVDATALLADLRAGRPVGWVRGGHELADVSSCGRLALVAPSDAGARELLLGALQRSESFLACRALIPAEQIDTWVDVPAGAKPSLATARLALPARELLVRSAPAVVGPDGCTWVQAVERSRDPKLHALLTEIGRGSGAPVLAAATLRLRGGVAPRSDADALALLDRSRLASLLVEQRLYRSSDSERTGAGGSGGAGAFGGAGAAGALGTKRAPSSTEIIR